MIIFDGWCDFMRIYKVSRCLCHTERFGLDHWISWEGGLLLPSWSTLLTSWMTRSCPWLTTGAQQGKRIMTTTVSTISLIMIVPCSRRLPPVQVTLIARSPAKNGSPWFTQVFQRWWCCVTFHQTLLSLHSALGLSNIGKTPQSRGISSQMDCLGSGSRGMFVLLDLRRCVYASSVQMEQMSIEMDKQHKHAQRWLPSPLCMLLLT